MTVRHQVESFKFWDIVTLWAKEELESEEVVARALAKGIIRDGLRLERGPAPTRAALGFRDRITVRGD